MREYFAGSLSEFYEQVNLIASQDIGRKENSPFPLLWYRGLSENWHNLLPTLYRGLVDQEDSNAPVYNRIKQKEDARYQHFKSRTYHFVNTNPHTESEWLEIYQHHMGKTRLMDWTESARKALCFAVEAFLDSRDNEDLRKKRSSMTPTVTVINPCKLNQIVYRYFYENDEYIERAVKELFPTARNGIRSIVDDIRDKMRENEDIFLAPSEKDTEMGSIVSLCVLEDMRDIVGYQLIERIKSMEFNPFYYLILRYYTDALPINVNSETDRILPPLAVLHPYHSERIRKQRGTFTVYPNYKLSHDMYELYDKRGVDVRVMERQLEVNPLLSRIYITNPQRVAKELLYAGERRTELYPGLDDFAYLLETVNYFV